MKKLLMLFFLAGTMPLASMAQDDLYFTPKKVAKAQAEPETPAYYCGSSRSVDEYNRRGSLSSWYQKIGSDTLGNDIIAFQGGAGVYPDSSYVDTAFVYPGSAQFGTQSDDYACTRELSRWDGYYDPWFSPYWRYGWYDPWYYGSWYGYHGWYDPWYYGYGWYGPWHHGWYGGYYGGWYGGWGHGGYVHGTPGTRNHGYIARNTTGAYGGNFGTRRNAGVTGASGSGSRSRFGSRSNNSRDSYSSSRSTFGSRSTGSNATRNSSPSYSNSRSTSSFGGGGFSGGGSRGGGFSGGHSSGGGGGHFGGRR